ncbi:MAG: type VII secretion-associated protein [Pseudonocardiaceae bacterium]
MLRVAIDFGTSATCTAAVRNGGPVHVVVIDGAPLMPSAVYAAADGTLFVGQEAERQAAIDPSRYEPHPKRRIDEGELLLGDTVVGVAEVMRAVLWRAVGEARRLAGGAKVDELVLTHPADWGTPRTRLLVEAARGLAVRLVLVPEPVAAALFYVSEAMPGSPAAAPDAVLAVFDLGAGTVDATVVARAGPGFRTLATRGDPSFGGADIDQALLEHVGATATRTDPAAWRALVEGRELADRRRRRVLRTDLRNAKETLSRHAYTDVPMPSPFPDAHLTRTDLEGLVGARLTEAVGLLQATLHDAGYGPGGGRLSGIFLVGGSSRIPMVARLVHERIGIVPLTLESPETVVARGALRAGRHRGDPARPGPGPIPPAVSTSRPPAGPPRSGRPSPVRSPPVPSPPVPAPTGGPEPPAGLRGQRGRWIAAGLAGLLIVGGVAIAALAGSGGGESTLVRYEYRFVLPDGWEEAGGDPDRLQVQIAPARSGGLAAVIVEETRLNYDSDADPAKAERQLRDLVAAADPAEYFGFDPDVSFAGRDVLHYRQRTDEGSMVDWYVLFERAVQLSVGCRYPPSGGSADVAEACREVVGSIDVRP